MIPTKSKNTNLSILIFFIITSVAFYFIIHKFTLPEWCAKLIYTIFRSFLSNEAFRAEEELDAIASLIVSMVFSITLIVCIQYHFRTAKAKDKNI